MQTVLVVGLGEIGSTVYTVLKESQKFNLYGVDFDKTKMEESQTTNPPPGTKIDVMHVCIPTSDKERFIEVIQHYVEDFNPKLTIVNSTIPIGTTMGLYKQIGGLVAHSPCRGVHKNKQYMIKELKRWTKYVGGATPEAGAQAEKHFKKAGLKTKQLKNCTETEFAKLFETTYRTWMITFFQKMQRLANKYNKDNPDLNIEFNETVDFIEDTHRQRHDRPVMFPNPIGGHCLLPNAHLMLAEYEPEMLNMILESNKQMIKEMQDPQIAKESKKVAVRVCEFEKEQDKKVLS
jgi:UDP-N-acetyl-D-mannosaminuronate dehydrogenase